MEPLKLDEGSGAPRPGLLIFSAVGIAVASAILLVITGLVIASIANFDSTAQGYLLMACLVIGLAVGLLFYVRGRQQPVPATTTIGAEGVSRSVGDFHATARWDEISWIAFIKHNDLAGDMLVISIQRPEQLVPPVRGLRNRARLNERLYGGAVILPLKGLHLSETELSEGVAALSDGRHTVERRAPAG